MTLLAAYQVLLSRYAGQDDFAVGSPSAGRHAARAGRRRRHVRQHAGRCAPSWPATRRSPTAGPRRAHRAWTPSSTRTCRSTGSSRELGVPRDVSPLAGVPGDVRAAELRPRPVSTPAHAAIAVPGCRRPRTTRFDLELYAVRPAPAGCGACSCTTPHLFDPADRSRGWPGTCGAPRGGGGRRPGPACARTSTCSGRHEARALVTAGLTTPLPTSAPAATLPGLIEEQVDRTPDAVAVVCDGRGLSPTRELDARGQPARAPAARGAASARRRWSASAPSARLELVVALLGVLKAGGAYVPLDPGLPGRPAGLHARPTPARRSCSPSSACATGCRRRRGRGAAGRPGRWSGPARHRSGRGPAGQPGLRHLHLRLDRPAQGRA